MKEKVYSTFTNSSKRKSFKTPFLWVYKTKAIHNNNTNNNQCYSNNLSLLTRINLLAQYKLAIRANKAFN